MVRERFLQQTLCKVALSNTSYDDQGKLPCDEDTRVEILADIKRWVDDVSAGSQNFFWLTGDPGCGKSAIAASLARYCKDAGTLWAQFFINRNNEATTNPRFYFPSIALQMYDHTSGEAIFETIYQIINRRPSVLDEISLNQAFSLFLQTVHMACDLNPSKTVAIVIDGLDETRPDKLQYTADIFLQLFKSVTRRNAKVFISSRTEYEITIPFGLALQSDDCRVKHIHLNTSDLSSIQDVSRYLSRNVKRIAEEWNFDWEQWPGKGLEMLCVRAGGLFIWAVAVIKFIQEQLRNFEHEPLIELLDVVNGDVDRLYRTILANTMAQGYWEWEKFKRIIGLIIMLKEPLPIRDIGTLLQVGRTPSIKSLNVLHFVTKLRTILVAGTESITQDTIPRLHKSFVEYITSHRADAQLRINVSKGEGHIAIMCLRLLVQLKDPGRRALLSGKSVQYAIHHWTRHLPGNGVSETGIGIVGNDARALRVILSTTATLRNGFVSASGDYRTHMYDPTMGFPPPTSYTYTRCSTIRSNGIWAIAVSSDGRLIASGDSSGDVQIWDSSSHEAIGKANKHGGCVFSVCFSPDSHWLLSASDDNTVRIWDCGTGQAVGSPLVGHTDDVKSVCTDGQRIISGSSDETIRVWSRNTSQIGSAIIAGGAVLAVALSNDRIVAGVGHNVNVFDVETRRQIASMKGHTNMVWTVALSPDGRRIASGSMDNTIRIWDFQIGKPTLKLEGHTRYVHSVAFSPNGRWITSGSWDKTVRVWNSETGEPVGSPLTEHTNLVTSVAFSPDNLHVISGSYDRTVRIWSPLFKWQKPSQQITAIHISRHPATSPDDRISLEGHPCVISACCSPDGSLYAVSTLEGSVLMWNTERRLIWETNLTQAIHPIHSLRFSGNRLILSAPDGSTMAWTLLDGRPTHMEPIRHGPQHNLHHSTNLSKGLYRPTMVSWIPFDVDAGLWAFVEGSFINFDSEAGSATIIDVEDGIRS